MAQVAQLFSIQAIEQQEEELGRGGPNHTWQVHELTLLDSLLIEYKDLFVEPKTLPPKRPLDHVIPLIPNVVPVNIRSYRYPPKLKSKIKKMVRDMLNQSIIRPSHNPFTSPVLLVKKKRCLLVLLC